MRSYHLQLLDSLLQYIFMLFMYKYLSVGTRFARPRFGSYAYKTVLFSSHPQKSLFLYKKKKKKKRENNSSVYQWKILAPTINKVSIKLWHPIKLIETAKPLIQIHPFMHEAKTILENLPKRYICTQYIPEQVHSGWFIEIRWHIWTCLGLWTQGSCLGQWDTLVLNFANKWFFCFSFQQ